MKKIYIFLSAGSLLLLNFSYAQNTWVQKASFPGAARNAAFGFSIGTKGYFGTGISGSTQYSDFWEWDQSTNTWTQKSSLNSARYVAQSWEINGMGYCCMGFNSSQINDLWAYDPSTNNWTQKANFGGAARYGAGSFSIGSKGYIGLGCPAGGNGPYSTDFWEYDSNTNSWTQKATPAMAQRAGMGGGFAVGTNGYIGFGGDGSISTVYSDLWQYNQTTNTWAQKASLPGSARGYPIYFAMAGKGYVGLGHNGSTNLNDFWEYNPATDTWIQRATFIGNARWVASSFSIGAKGYIGLGFDFTNNYNDFYEYTPINVGIDEQSSFVNHCTLYPTIVSDHATLEIDIAANLVNTQINIFDLSGKLIKTIPVSEKKFTFEKGDLAEGSYLYVVLDNNKKIGCGKFIAAQ